MTDTTSTTTNTDATDTEESVTSVTDVPVTPDSEATDTEVADETTEDTEATYPAHIVKKLRSEAAAYRQRAHDAEARADELARELHTAKVAQTGKLEVATDLDFDPEHLTNDEKLMQALDALLAKRPHLASRRPVGSIGQGYAGSKGGPADLGALLRRGAGG